MTISEQGKQIIPLMSTVEGESGVLDWQLHM